MPAVEQHYPGEVVAGQRVMDVDSIVHFPFHGEDVARQSPAQTLSQEIEEVDGGNMVWMEVCFVQCLSVRVAQVNGVIAVAPQIQVFASAGVRHRRVTADNPVDEDAPNAHGNPLDIDLWFLPKPSEFTMKVFRCIHGRPTEGTITVIKANRNPHLTKQPGVQFEDRKIGTIKFGNRGGVGEISAPHGFGTPSAVPGDNNNGDSDVDDWFVGKQATYVRTRIANVANSFPNTNAALTAPTPDPQCFGTGGARRTRC